MQEARSACYMRETWVESFNTLTAMDSIHIKSGSGHTTYLLNYIIFSYYFTTKACFLQFLLFLPVTTTMGRVIRLYWVHKYTCHLHFSVL